MTNKEKLIAKKIIEEIKKNKTFDKKQIIKLEQLLYKDENGKTLLQHIIENNIDYNYLLIPNISQSYRIINILYNYNIIDELRNIPTELFLSKITKNKTLIELLIEKNIIDKMYITELEYDERLINIIKKYKKYELLNKINITEELLFSKINNKILIEELIELEMLEYIKKQKIKSYPQIIEILKKYKRLDLLNKFIFQEELLLNNNGYLLNEIIKEGYTPILKNCTIKTLKYLYINDKPQHIMNLISYSDSNELLFTKIFQNQITLEYLLSQKNIEINIKELTKKLNDLKISQLIDVYLIFAKYNQLEYIEPINKDMLLSKNKNEESLLDIFLLENKELTKKILEYSNLSNDLDIIIYLKINDVDLNLNDINFELIDNDSYSYEHMIKQNKKISNNINYEILTEEQKELLFELEVLMTDKNINIELLEALIMSYAKEFSKNNPYALIELQKIIKIKKENPHITINRDYNNVYFSKTSGLHLSTVNINAINHELGHLLHYFITDNEIPKELENIIKNIKSNPNIKEKIFTYSKILRNNLENIKNKIEIDYDNWISNIYTEEIEDKINTLLEKEKNKRKKYLEKKGYDKNKIEKTLNEIFTLENYLKNQKRIKCTEMKDNVIDLYYSDLEAIYDMIDAIYEGEFYDSKLKTNNNEIILGTCGHGIVYYSSKEYIFQELIANYIQITKSDNKEKVINIINEILGEEFITILEKFYIEKIIKSEEYNIHKIKK